MKISVTIIWGCLAMLLVGGCIKDDAVQQPFSRLTVINGYGAESRLTYALDGNTFHSGDYTTARSFEIHIGNRRFRVQDPNQTTLVDTTVRIDPWNYYTTFSYGTEQSPKLLLTKDSLLPDIERQVAVRFINLANNVAAIDIYEGETLVELLTNRPQESASTVANSQVFLPIGAAGNRVFSAKDSAGNVIATSREIAFTPGRHVTLILWGTGGSQADPVKLVSY